MYYIFSIWQHFNWKMYDSCSWLWQLMNNNEHVLLINKYQDCWSKLRIWFFMSEFVIMFNLSSSVSSPNQLDEEIIQKQIQSLTYCEHTASNEEAHITSYFTCKIMWETKVWMCCNLVSRKQHCYGRLYFKNIKWIFLISNDCLYSCTTVQNHLSTNTLTKKWWHFIRPYLYCWFILQFRKINIKLQKILPRNTKQVFTITHISQNDTW